MTDRVALVTGASGGLGRAAAVALATDGHAVACAYSSNDTGAKETVRLIEEAGGRAESFGTDVADEHRVGDLFRSVSNWAGPPLIVVGAAGILRDGLTVRYPADEFDRILRVNVTGTFLCARAALPAMLKARWGRIVAVSSAAALRGNPGQAAYSASKAGLLGMTRSLAREYGSRGITVNAVCPGFVETDMTAGFLEKNRERMIEEIPVGRFGTAEEIAAAIRFLAGEAASYVNGAVLSVDGGLTA
jgi:3-oxoacyl-[acyl-carrier protein] reductase